MHKVTLAVATLVTFTSIATLSPAMADSYYGPIKVGNLCWKKQLGNSLGYWEECKPAKSAQASARRPGR